MKPKLIALFLLVGTLPLIAGAAVSYFLASGALVVCNTAIDG